MIISKNTHWLACCALGVFSSAAVAGPLPGGASSLSETYENWELNCADQSDNVVCSLTQVQIDTQTQQQILAIELQSDGEGGLAGAIVLPFGLALSQGATIGIDEQDANAALGFTTCLPIGCLVPIGFDASSIESLASANQLTVNAIINDSGEPISFSISLSGLQNAQQRLQAVLGN